MGVLKRDPSSIVPTCLEKKDSVRRSEAVNFFGMSFVYEFSGREFGERTARIEGYVCLGIYIYMYINIHTDRHLFWFCVTDFSVVVQPVSVG